MALGAKEVRRGNRRRNRTLRAAVPVAERRRGRRRRIGLILFLLVGLPALGAGLLFGGRAAWRELFAENDFFQIRHVEVTTDGELGAKLIEEYAEVRTGLNLFALRPEKIRASLLAVPVIASAQVGRRLPDTLVIEVAERVAVARLGWPRSGAPLAVDATGHVLGPSSVRASLPVVVGVRDKGLRPGDVVQDPMLTEALTVLEICNHERLRPDLAVASIDLGNEDRLEVGLATGETVLLARDRLADRLEKLRAMRSEARKRGLDLAVYDMTVERNYVGRPADWTDPVQTN